MRAALSLSVLLLLVSGGLGLAHGVVARAAPRLPSTLRWSAVLVLVVWSCQAIFLVLSPGGWFTFTGLVVLAVALVGVLAVWRTGREAAVAAVREDGRALGRLWSGVGRAVRFALIGTSAVLAVVLVRGLLSPPLAWDDLTYHLFKAGTWVGAGGFTSQPAPDAWSYYDYFPAGGEVLYAWGFALFPSGTLVAVVSVATWVACVGVSYAGARLLGVARPRSVLAGLAVGTVPAVLVAVDSAYVDNLLTVLVLVSFLFVVWFRRNGGLVPAVVAVAAIGAAVGVKQSAIPLAVAVGAWLAVSAWRRRPGPERSGARARGVGASALVALVLVVAVLPSAFWYARAAVDHGSPLYPFSVSVGPLELEGNAQHTSVLDGSYLEDPLPEEGLADRFLWADALYRPGRFDRNFQPLAFVYVPLAIAAVVLAIRRRERVADVLLLGVFAAAGLQLFLLPDSHGLRTSWATSAGRLILPSFAAAVLLGAIVRRVDRFSLEPLWHVLVWAQLALSARGVARSWSAPDDDALRSLLGGVWPYLLLVVAVGLLVRSFPGRRGIRAVAGVVVMAALLGAGAWVEEVRDDARDELYQAAADGEAYRVRGLSFACALPLATAVDGDDGAVVAVSTGWIDGGTAQWNGRYPFLGSDLQNSVEYVPVTGDGDVVDYEEADLVEERLDGSAWLQRLDERGVDFVVFIDPLPPERRVVERHPERFELLQTGCDGSRLYALRS